MSKEINVSVENNGVTYRAERNSVGIVRIYADSVWTGTGSWAPGGRIEDCAAVLSYAPDHELRAEESEAVYDSLEAALEAAAAAAAASE